MTDKNKVDKQVLFCKDLMERLNDNILSARESYGAIEKHPVMQNDIIRLRRELMTLSEMLDPGKKM